MLLYHISFRGAVYTIYLNVQRIFFYLVWQHLNRLDLVRSLEENSSPLYFVTVTGYFLHFLNSTIFTTITKVLGGVQLVDVLLVLLHHQVPLHLQCRAHLTTWDILTMQKHV